ncbi:DUF397 domain-containing protein [Actinomadura sp. LOL_016]|uniref:DUF397 domain-containing protein n=1 Tax=unclassified Actinomadura TaxID=2626254 RepID=UPI003A80177C
MDLSRPVWRKSTRSKEDGSNCVEVAPISDTIAIRDSKDPDGPLLSVRRAEFRRFAEVLKGL